MAHQKTKHFQESHTNKQETNEDSTESSLDSTSSEEVIQEQDVSNEAELTADTESIDTLKNAYKDLEERYMRVYADFENVKKRLERDKNQALEYAYERIAKELLPILDALESAKEAAKEHNAILEGITHTKDNFLKVLQRHGVEEIATNGEFDPNLHECIMQVSKPEAENGQIAQVLQKGYTYKERTLRPAMVAVVKND